MHRIVLAAVVLALMPVSANAAAWVAVCYGRDAQYMQEIGGAGYFHMGAGDGTYDTQRLYQTYFDGNIVCGAADPKAPEASEHVAQVCADKTRKVISVLYQDDTKRGVQFKNAPVYCDARVSIH